VSHDDREAFLDRLDEYLDIRDRYRESQSWRDSGNKDAIEHKYLSARGLLGTALIYLIPDSGDEQ